MNIEEKPYENGIQYMPKIEFARNRTRIHMQDAGVGSQKFSSGGFLDQ
jgi:hypothetical protein